MKKHSDNNIPYPFKLCQEDKLLLYFHRLHQARMVADVQGKRAMKEEGKRIKEKYLFVESLEAGNL